MRTIGVLDSGIGGLTTCNYIFRQMPHINIIYFADNANAPYGTRNGAEIYSAVRCGVAKLFDVGCEVVVLACNTATAVCAEGLRNEFNLPIVGTEPALKPAREATGKTLLTATPLTLKSRAYGGARMADTALLATFLEHAFGNDCVKKTLTENLNLQHYDNVVLGCTHYVFLRKEISESFPEISVFDGGEGVAREVARQVRDVPLSGGGRLFITFSGKREYARYLSAYRTAEKFL